MRSLIRGLSCALLVSNALGVSFADIGAVLSTAVGSAYINDFPNLGNLARRGQAALAQNDNRRAHQPCHLSPGTMISEKYGEDAGST